MRALIENTIYIIFIQCKYMILHSCQINYIVIIESNIYPIMIWRIICCGSAIFVLVENNISKLAVNLRTTIATVLLRSGSYFFTNFCIHHEG